MKDNQKLKLITALGNKDLVLELIDFLGGDVRLSYNQAGTAIRRRFAGMELPDLYLICTKDVEGLLENELAPQLAVEYPGLRIHPLHLDCADIACGNDDEFMRQSVYETVKEIAADNLIISSGGRKTVTNRLIEAGLLYGCRGYLTITAPKGKERDPGIRRLTMDLNVLWISARQFSEERRKQLIKDELGDNFRSLYFLPLTMIERLRQERIGVDPMREKDDLDWLGRLPKADLHCHLGGSYDTALLKELAANLLDELGVLSDRRETVSAAIKKTTGKAISDLNSFDLKKLRTEKAGKPVIHALQNLACLWRGLPEPAYVCTAVLIAGLSPEQIDEISRDGRAAGDFLQDLGWYMACGDLGGSALLQTAGNLRRALRWLMAEGEKENTRFMEVRFSPDNYTRAGLTIPVVIETLFAEARQFMEGHPGFRINFLIMATRHKETAAMAAHVAAAVTFGQTGQGEGPRLVGFDLAGQEEGNDPARFHDIFMPLHHHFINITIHAGEMEEDDRIWQAIYLLHARRIGHGLKLINNRRMMGYVRDHGIAIEMCPSSNAQTNDFRHFDGNRTRGDTYPLREYLDCGLAVTVNTDNRGISDTTLSREYLRAARLTAGGLSRWEILRLVKNGFKASFLPKDEKDQLLKKMDGKVFALILDNFFPEDTA